MDDSKLSRDTVKEVATLQRTSDIPHIDYGEEIFISITNENHVEVINGICQSIYYMNLSIEETIPEIANEYMTELRKLLELLPRPFTIVQEFYYIDRSYRDAYYTYFSNQHFDIKRYSRRLSLIGGIVTRDMFFSTDDKLRDEIASKYMGACVVNPLSVGVIGRTLIDPRYIIAHDKPVHVRLSEFTLHVYGSKFHVMAFPYRMQDGETMRCTEVTLLNLIEYYSNSYRDYKNAVPSEILDNEQKHHHERVLPSRGISYPMLSKVLYEFGFSPRLYNYSEIKRYALSKMTQEDELKRLLYYYIESGIPVALNLQPMVGNDVGHSIVCIGHGYKKNELENKAQKNKWITWSDRTTCHPLIDAADYYDEFVVVDDNQPVYQVRKFDHLSLYSDMRAVSIAVPLYKRMFLDASDAAAIMRSILFHKQLGIDQWTNEFLKENEDVVIRMFMASSHSLKDFRTKTLKDIFAREAYGLVPMPRFVWVCEVYRERDYDGSPNSMAFGEIVIDATSTSGAVNCTRSLIIMHYPHVLGLRFPEQSEAEIDQMIELDNDDLFPAFSKNLDIIS